MPVIVVPIKSAPIQTPVQVQEALKLKAALGMLFNKLKLVNG